jgi:hypothetical protein
MTRAPKFLLVFALLASAAPLDLSAWKYRKRIPLTPSGEMAVVKVDRETFTGAAFDLADLRVVRDGIEVPYYLETLATEGASVSGPVQPIDLSIVDGPALQFTVNVGRTEHNQIRIHTTEQNFRQRVRIEASADNRHWATLRNDGAIFDFTQDSRQFSSLDVDFPVSTKPFLRVTIFGWNKVDAVQNVTVGYQVVRPVVRETFATVAPQIIEDAKEQATIATLDLGVEGLPVDHLVLEVGSPRFHRAVDVEVSANGKDWSYLAQGVIARLPGSDFTEESLGLFIPETHQRFLRIRIYNRDDQPVQLGRIQLEGLSRYVNFYATAAGDYWLYYGDANVRAPVYDLNFSRRFQDVSNHAWTLGPGGPNPAYRPPAAPRKPWSEQHPAILYTVLGGAVLALGIATFRFAARLR